MLGGVPGTQRAVVASRTVHWPSRPGAWPLDPEGTEPVETVGGQE